jgi:hypothetical protein
MPNYWLGIMAVAFAIALTVWISLVFWAGRKTPDRPEDPLPPREIIGGVFEAHLGGRQVMPDPREPIIHDDETSTVVPEQRKGPVTGTVVPEQRKGPVPEQEPAARDGHQARR